MTVSQESKVEKLIKEIHSLRNENHSLKEQLDWFKRQIFGKRSEKDIRSLDDTNESYFPGFKEFLKETSDNEKDEVKPISAHIRKKAKQHGKNKISFPDDLPVEEIVLDMPEDDKTCPNTGKPLVKIGEEISSKLAYRPGSYFIKKYIRPKYALPEGNGILTREMPDAIISKCRADESLLAEIFTSKFADHLPLYRISEKMMRKEIFISRQLLSEWVIKVGTALEPLKNLMHRKILESNNLFIDETPIDLLVKNKGKAHEAYMWVIVGGKGKDPPYRFYQFKTDRKHSNASNLLKNYRGVLHSDKYGAYETLANEKQIVWCPCWSHIRRKFFEANSADPEFRKWCLRKIRYLFMYERVAWSRSPDERLKIRQEKEVPIINELIDKIKERLIKGKILPKSKYREALGYFCGLIPHLKNYTNHPWAKLDNNVAERAIRPLAIGRKNWLFVGSVNGGKAAATLLSLVQTCRALKINPREYLEDVLRRFMGYNSCRLEDLLPDNWAKAQDQSFN